MNQSNLQNILLYSVGAAIVGCILINLNDKFINNHINEKYNNIKAFVLILITEYSRKLQVSDTGAR